MDQLEEPLGPTSVKGDEIVIADNPDVRLSEDDATSVLEPVPTPIIESSIPASSSGYSIDVQNAGGDVGEPAAAVASSEPEVDFSRLDIDAEQLVASLFGDDDSSISFEQQPPTDNKKGFVTADHEDATKWFYQDPQGVIQGETSAKFYLKRCIIVVFLNSAGIFVCFADFSALGNRWKIAFIPQHFSLQFYV